MYLTNCKLKSGVQDFVGNNHFNSVRKADSLTIRGSITKKVLSWHAEKIRFLRVAARKITVSTQRYRGGWRF